jgi:RimJ/RimL family protein N-acetyltransferase
MSRNSYELKSTRDYKGAGAVSLRRSREDDLAWITALERRPDNLEMIGQWSDAEHLDAIAGRDAREHWIIERAGEREGYLIAYDRSDRGAGLYVKRMLIDRKEHGTGSAALAAYLAHAWTRPGVDAVWLIVRDHNERAQAVYARLGFARFEPEGEEAARYDTVAEAPPERCFRMRKLAPGPSPRLRRPG